MLKSYSKNLRNHMTFHEKQLWKCLSNKQLMGVRFRRQHIIGCYIADFACLKHKLLVECDGNQHLSAIEYDSIRDTILERSGFQTLRFTNQEIEYEIESVVERIKNYLRF